MDRHYYHWIETVILYRDVSGNTCDVVDKPAFEEYQRGWNYNLSYDNPDITNKQKLLKYIQEFDEHIHFQDDCWDCSEGTKTRLLALCAQHDISEKSLVRVYTKMNGYWL